MTARRPILLLPFLLLGVGCTTMATLTEPDNPQCAAQLEQGLQSILQEQGEKDEAEDLARNTSGWLAKNASVYGPRPFFVAAKSGTDYHFFVDKRGKKCLLRLYGRQKGFVSYTNTMTFIGTRELPACMCVK